MMNETERRATIARGRAVLGIEFGSTRIKLCLTAAEQSVVLATGIHEWRSSLVGGFWTYSLEQIHDGLQAAYRDLSRNVVSQYGVAVADLAAVGVSAMMHGYLAFDAEGALLTPYRTWRNTNTAQAAALLSAELEMNIPMRWSVAHLHQAILDREEHVSRISSLTTLSGFVHRLLTGQNVVGIGDASGMFPVGTAAWDEDLLDRYDAMSALQVPIRELLPRVQCAGTSAGELTAEGAQLLDPTGALRSGAVFCPPEGDAGTGMVATRAVVPRTGNVSVGTSIFAMVVLEQPLTGTNPEVDLVATPDGTPVAMIHCNNGADELAGWARVFGQFADAHGANNDPDEVFATLFREALKGEADAGGIVSYNQLAGEPVVSLDQGRPMVVRTPTGQLTLANLMRAHLLGTFAALSIGMKLLTDEGVRLDRIAGHGGVFRTEGVAQRLLAAALGVEVAVSSTASEGGAWGMAELASFTLDRAEVSLAEFLERRAVGVEKSDVTAPDAADSAGFTTFLERYVDGLEAVRVAGARIG